MLALAGRIYFLFLPPVLRVGLFYFLRWSSPCTCRSLACCAAVYFLWIDQRLITGMWAVYWRLMSCVGLFLVAGLFFGLAAMGRPASVSSEFAHLVGKLGPLPVRAGLLILMRLTRGDGSTRMLVCLFALRKQCTPVFGLVLSLVRVALIYFCRACECRVPSTIPARDSTVP